MANEMGALEAPELDWPQLGDWLGCYVREAAERDARVRDLMQRVHTATAALAGIEGDALTSALRVQEHALWALIQDTVDRHRAAEAGDGTV
ncbi:MAG: hypothetical protein QOH33_2115 [Paraburkholderia sp.]|nr:hypothetical protein [Paraburkholderia sp.]